MTTNKKTMYEILQVSSTASLAEIKAAHKRLSLEVMSASPALSREDCNFRLNLLDVALHTLSVPVLRDAYDAQLASTKASANVALPGKSSLVPAGDQATALRIAAAIILKRLCKDLVEALIAEDTALTGNCWLIMLAAH